jgi:acetyl esterase/lipase
MRYQAVAFAALLLVGGCKAVVRQSTFFPASVQPPHATLAPPPDYRLEDAMIALPGLGRVHAVRLDNPKSDTTIIYVGGNMSFVAGQTGTAASLAAATGADIILYDYPGRGGTDVPGTLDAAIAFGPALVAELRARHWIGTGALFVYGVSLGGSQAAGIARAARPAGLIIEGSAADIAAIGHNAVPALMRPFVSIRVDAELARFDYVGYMAEAKAPVLLISSRGDTLVRPRNMAAFAQQLRNRGVPVSIAHVPGAHGSALHEPAAIDAVKRFVAAKQ